MAAGGAAKLSELARRKLEPPSPDESSGHRLQSSRQGNDTRWKAPSCLTTSTCVADCLLRQYHIHTKRLASPVAGRDQFTAGIFWTIHAGYLGSSPTIFPDCEITLLSLIESPSQLLRFTAPPASVFRSLSLLRLLHFAYADQTLCSPRAPTLM